MKNRYGIEYDFIKVSPNRYRFEMDKKEMNYMQCGAKEGQGKLDMSDLAFFDPSGGPFVEIGSPVDGRRVKHIEWNDEGIFVEVEAT